MITLLTFCYLACFQAAALPAMVRVVRRKSSADLSCWRELLLLTGVCLQLSVFLAAGVRDWRVLASPVATFVSVSALLGLIWRYRRG